MPSLALRAEGSKPCLIRVGRRGGGRGRRGARLARCWQQCRDHLGIQGCQDLGVGGLVGQPAKGGAFGQHRHELHAGSRVLHAQIGIVLHHGDHRSLVQASVSLAHDFGKRVLIRPCRHLAGRLLTSGRHPAFGVTILKVEAVPLQTELSGRTVVAQSSEVRPQVSGIVKTRSVEEGSLVKAGQVLYVIEPAGYRAAYDEARAALVSAEAAVSAAQLKSERYTEFLAIEGVAKQDPDDAASSWKQAVAAVAQKKAATETARINLGYTQVRAPIAGRMGKSSVTPGALVTASQTTALATSAPSTPSTWM